MRVHLYGGEGQENVPENKFPRLFIKTGRLDYVESKKLCTRLCKSTKIIPLVQRVTA